jgi:hypothetical protein
MNCKLQELLENKIKIYEQIIYKIKNTDSALISTFYLEFEKLEKIDRNIKEDPIIATERIMKIKL